MRVASSVCRGVGCAAAALVLACARAGGTSVADQPGTRLTPGPAFARAQAIIDRDHDTLVDDIIHLTEIPAPPFKEDARGAAFLALLKQTRLTNVERDAAGNVMGVRKGTGGGPLVAVAAHLDTVFPEGTDVHVKRQGTRLSAPGVGDDARSLAVLIAIVRALDEADVRTMSDILFVADVGEEGAGDLRGMKELFLKGPYKDRIKAFISIDGTGEGSEITNAAVGSRRYHVVFKGPGGHSYGAFGLVSPTFALADAVDRISRLKVPATPKTTFNVGVIGGGTSVNAIPDHAWMDLDLRSESAAELEKLDASVRAILRQAVDDENAARSGASGALTMGMMPIGNRPSGQTPPSAPLVQTAEAAVRTMGMSPRLASGSTDANLPISLGIPAITIDSGGTGDRAHAVDEWIDVAKPASVKGISTALLILLTVAGAG